MSACGEHSAMFEINGRVIGAGHPCYIIAELSANHLQSFERAIQLIEAAKTAGADAIKLQTYLPETMTLNSDLPCFQIEGTIWQGKSLYDVYAEAYTPWEWHAPLQAHAEALGLDFFSSPFDASAVDFLETLHVPVYKIASFENVDIPLLKYVAKTGKPVIMSTGMASLAEIEEAVQTLRTHGCSHIALLKCTSAYPASPADANLCTIPHLAQTFAVQAGLSDHTPGSTVPVAAVVLGAALIEKHLTLSRADGGPDGAFSMEPAEFQQMVQAVRTAEAALGKVHYGLTQHESRRYRRSLFIVKDLAAGEVLTADAVRAIRPGNGLHTRYLEHVLGRRVRKAIAQGTPLDWSLLEPATEA